VTSDPSAAEIYGRDFPVGAVALDARAPGALGDRPALERRLEPEESRGNAP